MQNDQARPTDKAVRLTKANKDDEPDVNEMFGDKNGVSTFEGPPIERLDNRLAGAAETSKETKVPEPKPITPETPKPPKTPETPKGDYAAPKPPEPVNEAVADAQTGAADVKLTDYVTPEQQTQWETEHGGEPQPDPQPEEPAPESQPERGGSDRERRQREAEAREERDKTREQRKKEAEGEEADPQEIEGENASEDTNALGGPEETSEDDDTDSKGTALGSTPATGAAADRADEEVRRMQAEKRWRSTKDALVTIAAMMPGEALNATGKGLNSINSLVDGFLSGKMMSQGSRIVADSLAMADTVNQSAKRIHERYGILRDADPEIVRQTYKGRMMQARSEAEMKGIARAHLFVEDRLSGRDIENLTMDDLDSLDTAMTGDIARLKAEFARDRADRQNGGKGTMTKEERASGLAQLHSYDDVLKEMKKQRSSLRADELEQKRRTKERTAAQAQADYDNGTDDQRAIWDIVGKGVELDPDTGMPADGRFLSKIEGQLKAAQLRDPQNPMWERLLSQNKAYRQKLARNPNTGTDAGGRVALNAIVTESRRNMADLLRNQGLDPDAVFADPQKLMAQIQSSDEFREQYNRYAMNSNDLDMRDLTGLASQYSRSDPVMATMMNRITARAAQLQKDEAQARMAGAVIGEDSVFKQYVQYVNTFFGPSTARVRKGMDTRMNKLADDLEAEFAVTKDPAVKKEADELRDRAMLLMDSFDPQTQDPAQARQDYLVGLADASMRIHDAKEGLDRRASIRKEDERRAIEQQREQIRMAREYNKAQEKADQEEQKRREEEAKAEEERFNSVKDEKIKGMQDQKDAAAAEAQKEIDRRAGRWTEKEYDAKVREIDEQLKKLRPDDEIERARRIQEGEEPNPDDAAYENLLWERREAENGAWISGGLADTGILTKKIADRFKGDKTAMKNVRKKLDRQLRDLYQRDIEDHEQGRQSDNFYNAKKYLQILTSPEADAVWRNLKTAKMNMDAAGLPVDHPSYKEVLKLQSYFSDFSLDDFFDGRSEDEGSLKSKVMDAYGLKNLKYKHNGDDDDRTINVDSAKRNAEIRNIINEVKGVNDIGRSEAPTAEPEEVVLQEPESEKPQVEPEDTPKKGAKADRGYGGVEYLSDSPTDEEKAWHKSTIGKIGQKFSPKNFNSDSSMRDAVETYMRGQINMLTRNPGKLNEKELNEALNTLALIDRYNQKMAKGRNSGDPRAQGWRYLTDDPKNETTGIPYSEPLRAYHKFLEMKEKNPDDPNLYEYLKNPDFVPEPPKIETPKAPEVKQPKADDIDEKERKKKEKAEVEKKKRDDELIALKTFGNSIDRGESSGDLDDWKDIVKIANAYKRAYKKNTGGADLLTVSDDNIRDASEHFKQAKKILLAHQNLKNQVKAANNTATIPGLDEGIDVHSKAAWDWATTLAKDPKYVDKIKDPSKSKNEGNRKIFRQAKKILGDKKSYGNLSDEEKKKDRRRREEGRK